MHRLRFCLFVFKYPMQIIDAKAEGNFCCCCHQLSETSLNQASETGGPGALYLWRHVAWAQRAVAVSATLRTLYQCLVLLNQQQSKQSKMKSSWWGYQNYLFYQVDNLGGRIIIVRR